MFTYTYEELLKEHPHRLRGYTFITTVLDVKDPQRGLTVRETETRPFYISKDGKNLEGFLVETMQNVIESLSVRFGMGKDSESDDFIFRLV